MSNSTAEEDARREAISIFLLMTGGNPGTLVLGRQLEQAGYFDITELVPLAQELGLVNNALYILHRDFGGKVLAVTAELLEALKRNPDLEGRQARTGQVLRVLDDVLESMHADFVHLSA
jgi:hypothetical protein